MRHRERQALHQEAQSKCHRPVRRWERRVFRQEAQSKHLRLVRRREHQVLHQEAQSERHRPVRHLERQVLRREARSECLRPEGHREHHPLHQEHLRPCQEENRRLRSFRRVASFRLACQEDRQRRWRELHLRRERQCSVRLVAHWLRALMSSRRGSNWRLIEESQTTHRPKLEDTFLCGSSICSNSFETE